jgi:hypothetical protein
MIFVRQPAAVAERRRAERTIKAIAPMRTAKPMTIQSQMRPEPDPFAGAVALALGCAAGAGAAELEGADEVTDGTEGLELVAAGELVIPAGEELVIPAAGELVIPAGEELVLSAGEELAVWPVDRLAIALLMLLLMLEPHAVARPAAQRIVAARSRLPVRRRINGPFPRGQRQCFAFSLASSASRRVTQNG